MYDVRQFKPALFLVVLLGLSGYALAAESPGLWVFATALVLTNVWLVRQGTFRPIPRLVANGVTVLAFGYAFLEVRSHGDSPILAIGQFLVLLQVVKVWEQRANRDYAQLLVLSLLLMVAAAISTASLLFGLLFVGYLLVTLYCCLLFHLKVEADGARAARLPSAEAVAAADDARGRGGDRDLAASMRRLTGLIAAYALVAAVVVFLLFPRGPGAGMFGQFVWRSRNTQTGFSEQVNFQTVASITRNDTPMGTVKVLRDGVAQPFAGPLLLRGLTHDYYSGDRPGDDSADGKYQWSHAPRQGHGRWGPMVEDKKDGSWSPATAAADPDADDGAVPATPAAAGDIRQEVDLSPTGTPVLFALAGLTRVRIDDPMAAKVRRVNYSAADQTIRSDDPLTQPVRYTVDSTGDLGDQPAGRTRSVIDPEITRFALRPDVTGGLADQRRREAAARPDGGLAYVSPLDEQIALRIEAYLKKNFAYTLDLTDLARGEKRDPMAAFLTDYKRGHCEYFAGAMTLMCQSLGMQARLVVGFKVDDYNPFGHYYTVRQSQAHTWVEVRTAQGWKPFDPTSGRDVAAAGAASLWQKTKSLVDFMEYTWQTSVINYNADNRDNLIQSMDARLTNSTYRSSSVLVRLRETFEAVGNWVATHVVGPVVVLLAAGLLGAVGWFGVERVRLRRRATRIGVDDLPAGAQARLVRQLAFYDGLVQLLARHRIARPPHLTPLEFSRSLSFLPPNAYDTVGRLTGVFYRIRFGGADLDDGRQRRLLAAVDRLESMMPAVGASAER